MLRRESSVKVVDPVEDAVLMVRLFVGMGSTFVANVLERLQRN